LLKNPEIDVGETVAHDFRRRWPKAQALRPQPQKIPQFKLALPDPVSDLAAVEAGEAGAGEFAPSVSLDCFQGVYVSA